MPERTSIKISKQLQDELRSLCFPGESLGHMLTRLLPEMAKANVKQGRQILQAKKKVD